MTVQTLDDNRELAQQLRVDSVRCSTAAGLKCTVYCTSVDKFAAVNTIYARYFPAGPPARVFVCVPAWPGTFDIEVDCVATI
jgi:2-iminobutanoate/2-iminopropanoate deaminase